MVSRVGDEQVGTAAQDEVRHPRILAGYENVANLVDVVGRYKDVSRSTDLEGGVLAQGFVKPYVVRAHNLP